MHRSPAAPARSSTATATSAASPGANTGAAAVSASAGQRRVGEPSRAGGAAGRCLPPARLHRHDRRRLLRRVRLPGGAPRRAGPGAVGSTASGHPGRRRRRRRSSTLTRGSSRLGSTALGSRRAGPAEQGHPAGRSGSQRLRSARLGAGLTHVPPAPQIDAGKAFMVEPEVPENKRVCPSCGSPVGRVARRPTGPHRGLLPQVRQPRSPSPPSCKPGDLVANQYEVAGCLAHGGLGWIYLARDKNVSDRWVVLKGLLNTGDDDALAVAIVEQQFLAQVEHPLIVEIYNFVTHDGAGYIVMEYVGGTSLKQILKQRMRATGGRLRPAAGRPGDRLHPGGAAGLPVPARPRPGLLRLQARQPDPDRRRGEADRPGRCPPARRRGVRDLRHGRLPGAGGGRRSAPPSPPTSTPSAGRCWC